MTGGLAGPVVLLVLLLDWAECRVETAGAAGAVAGTEGRIQPGLPGSNCAPRGPSFVACAAADCSSHGLCAKSCRAAAEAAV